MVLLSQQSDRRCIVGLSVNRNLLNSSGKLAKNTEEYETTRKKRIFLYFRLFDLFLLFFWATNLHQWMHANLRFSTLSNRFL